MNITRIHFESTDSTNAEAKRRIREGLKPDAADVHRAGCVEGTVITADHQTSGRGRFDRQWEDMAGQSVLASYILYPRRAPEEWGGLPLLAGLAVQRALSPLLPGGVQLKWPNDVLVDGKKICGILVESGMLGNQPWAVAGIGINVLQREFPGSYRYPPTSLLLERGQLTETGEVLQAVSMELGALYDRWQNEGSSFVIEEWKTHAQHMLPADIVLHQDGADRDVRAIGLAPSGALIVLNEKGEHEEVYAGDVSLHTGKETEE
ncbi:biotin--[acetyl-CoA-carboxylase] ligase [bacterium]|nr:biotin--[acetyl-CoA-carboxylase] ligase [bacterium]